jgi:hypothetical protein
LRQTGVLDQLLYFWQVVEGKGARCVHDYFPWRMAAS